MNQSIQSSFTIDSVLANLSESTEIDCSDDGIQFSEMVQKYQDETHAIQSILNSLYQQIDKSLSPTNQKNLSSNKSFSCSAIKEIQERLKSLERENEELSIQMRRFANISDVSSVQANNSRKFNQSIQQNSELNYASFVDNKYKSDVSKKSINDDSYWESKYHEQVAQNMRLTSELNTQKEMNKKFKKQQKYILTKLLSISNLHERKDCDEISQIENAILYFSKHFASCDSQKNHAHKIIYEIKDEKQKISETLNSFKNELQNLRFSTMQQLKRQQINTFSLKPENSKLFSETAQKSVSLFDNHHQSDTNIELSMIIRGCEELIDAISINFKGIQKTPINELISKPREFGKYINLIRSHLDANVGSLKKENNDLTRNLSLANNKIKAETLSPGIKSTIDNVMNLISKVTKEMQNEHQELLAQLS